MPLASQRGRVQGILYPLTGWLAGKRVHPNLLTTIGFLIAIGAALAFDQRLVRTAGFLVLLSGFFDIIDGQVARISELGSKFGAFYDATLDRIGEIAVFLGLLSLYNDYRLELGDVGMIYLIMIAMGGSLMVSYTKSKAETMGLDVDVGLMQRAERVIIIGLPALLFGLMWQGLVLKGAILVLAIFTNVTAIQRIVWVYRHAGGVPLEAGGPGAGVEGVAPEGEAPEPGPARGTPPRED
ncbi:MAG: CDP-alcohol phosphatidyltransferase family protein [Longimicrobiales bacterium]|nr:CDP-alcohol phosphatidyltransferase family protein [Longimicrobiales bacterium]